MSAVLAAMLCASFAGLGSVTNLFSRGEELTVASHRCDMDRKSGIVLFEGAARVDYRPGYTLLADRVFAIFSGTNELDRIVAVGDVTVTNESRVAVCDRAVFTRRMGELEIRGWPDGRPARLTDESGNSVAGSRMKFWLDASQVEVFDSELTFDKGGRSVKGL